LVRNAIEAERNGYAAFVIGHFQEPGLTEARAAVDIPVVGLGEATMLHACTLGRRIGLVTINSVLIACHADQVARHGLRDRVVAITTVDTQVADYNRAFEDADAYVQLRERFARERGLSVRNTAILNGIPVSLLAAERAVRLKRVHGITASRAGEYALPPLLSPHAGIDSNTRPLRGPLSTWS
jgi:allantoin racemase